MIQEKKSKLMQIKSVLEMHDFSGINRKVQLKKGNSSKALAETESEAEDTSKYFFERKLSLLSRAPSKE